MKTYQYKVQGVDYEVEIVEVEGKIARVNVNGIPFEIEMQKPINAAKHPVHCCCSVYCRSVETHTTCRSSWGWHSRQGTTAWHDQCHQREGGRYRCCR